LASQDPDWLLVGTAVADDPAFLPFAVIEHQPSRTQRAYHEGSYLGEHVIKKILDGAVVVSTHTGHARLSMADGRTTATSSPSEQVARLPRQEVNSTLPDETHLMQAIRVRPRFEAGQPGGFVIYSIEPDSIFARMGLQDGDVIAGVNGNSFTTTQPSVEFYNALKTGGTVSLEIKRGDSTQRLLFEIR
jgi:general secretion pathway protein C